MGRRKTFDRDAVAKVILEAMELGIPVAPTVAEIFDVGITRARYMARAVREEHHLGMAPHHPTRAYTRRSTVHERAWLVCDHDLLPWPCPEAFPFRSKMRANRGDD